MEETDKPSLRLCRYLFGEEWYQDYLDHQAGKEVKCRSCKGKGHKWFLLWCDSCADCYGTGKAFPFTIKRKEV